MHAEVNLALSNCRVEYDSDRLSDNEIHSLLSQKGYSPQKLQSNNLSSLSIPDSSQENSNWKWALIGTLPLFVLAMGPMANLQLPAFFNPSESPTAHVLTQWILILPVLWAGRDFYKNGVRSLIQWSPDMDTLVALGTGAALLWSFVSFILILQGTSLVDAPLYLETAGVIITMILIGRYLEGKKPQSSYKCNQRFVVAPAIKSKVSAG